MKVNRVVSGYAWLFLTALVQAGCGGGEQKEVPKPFPSIDPAVVAGLDERPSNTTCLAGSRPQASGASYELRQVFPNLTFNFPIALLQAPGDSGKWYVVERNGVVRVFDNIDSVASSSIFIDISSQVDTTFEGGLLAMAFHPEYPRIPYVYLYYTGVGFGH